MAFAVAFYLFDATFKLAIAVVFLPILAAFWPFGALRDKALACAKMIFNAAALFVFLSLTASMGLILVDKAIQIGDIARRSLAEDSVLQKEASDAGMSAIMAAISRGDSERVKKIFSLSTAAFLALIFSYLYAIKILRSTIDDYVNKFFEDSLTGRLQEMHHKMTGLVTAANQRAKQATVGLAKEAKAMGEAGLKKMGKSAANKFKQSSQNVDQLKDGNKPEK